MAPGWWSCAAPRPSTAPPPTPVRSCTGVAAVKRQRSLVRCGSGAGDTSSVFPDAALRAAAFRFQETNRPDPLLIDPYSGCFLSHGKENCQIPESMPTAALSSRNHYILASTFIDDKLTSMMSSADELRQVVLLTDGVDTRPYRLRWPRSTLIFDVSPGRVFKAASQRLEGLGAKIAKSCLLIHIPYESSNLQAALHQKGFSGSRPSVWVLQGLPVMALANVEEILSVVSSLAMKGSTFMGELPCCLIESEFQSKMDIQTWLDKIFMRNGLRVEIVDYNEITKSLHSTHAFEGSSSSVFFVAKQLQLSDEQMEKWRTEFQRIEEEGDEEGFED